MKKEEAKNISIDKSKLVIEYLTHILSEKDKVNGKMNFYWAKIENQDMCTLDIYVPKTNFEKHLNLGITTDHCDVFYAQLFDDLLANFLEHDTLGASYFTTIKGMIGSNFQGIYAVNGKTGSQIDVNFLYTGKDFPSITEHYNQTITEYVNKQNQNGARKK